MLVRFRLPLTVMALLAVALVALRGSRSAAPASAAPAALSTLVIFAPGIDAFQSTSFYDPYARAEATFGVDDSLEPSSSSIMGRLGCPLQPADPLAGQPPFIDCAGGNAWIPYSYAGVQTTPGGQLIAPYTGAMTGQRLQTSANAMDAIVTFARSFPVVTSATKIYLVAHSLGGAVSSFWASTHPEVTVITLDSPVNGFYPTDQQTLSIYCDNSVGLIQGVVQQLACENVALLPAFTAPVVADLHNPADRAKMGQANALNFGNIADIFVPTWFALNPKSKIGGILINDPCSQSGDYLYLYHGCILTGAAAAVATMLSTGVAPPLTPIRPTISLTITFYSYYIFPIDAPITLSHQGTVITTVNTVNGKAVVSVPWEDVLVQAQYKGYTISGAVLPAANQDLTLALNTFAVGSPLPGGPPLPLPLPPPTVPEPIPSPLPPCGSNLPSPSVLCSPARLPGRFPLLPSP